MAQTQLKSPNPQAVRKLYETIDEIINEGRDLVTMTDDCKAIHSIIAEPTLVNMRDALEWVYVFLMNRRDYHKGRNVTQKIKTQLLEEALARAGVDVEGVKKQAERAADEAIIDNDDEA